MRIKCCFQLNDEVVVETERCVAPLKRAVSCDSVCSDTSVVAADLHEPNVTGYLCIGLEYDRYIRRFIQQVLLSFLKVVFLYGSVIWFAKLY